MKCSKAQKQMIDYMDHQLKHSKVVTIENHLAVCPQCRQLLAEMTDVVNMAGELQAVVPPEGTWSKIEKKMAVGKQQPLLEIMQGFLEILMLYRRTAVAVGLAVVLIGVVVIFQQPMLFFNPGQEGVDSAAVQHFQEAERHYQLAIEAINRSLPDIETQLPSELAAEFINNLKIIDEAILACQAVIDRYPDNAIANEQLFICYRKKFELLNEIQRVLM